MKRLDEWAERLNEVIESNRNRPFKRGEFDCTRFAHLCLMAIYGQTPFDQYRQDHTTKEEAFAYLREIGCRNPWRLVDRHAQRIDLYCAKRGDLVGHRLFEAFSLGVCIGSSFVAPSDDGLEFIPIQNAVRAWSLDG